LFDWSGLMKKVTILAQVDEDEIQLLDFKHTLSWK
jgi:hypothetical protein